MMSVTHAAELYAIENRSQHFTPCLLDAVDRVFDILLPTLMVNPPLTEYHHRISPKQLRPPESLREEYRSTRHQTVLQAARSDHHRLGIQKLERIGCFVSSGDYRRIRPIRLINGFLQTANARQVF